MRGGPGHRSGPGTANATVSETMKLLHLADVHLGASYAGFGDLAAERAQEVLDAFRRLPDTAAAERVDAVLIAGDLFDAPQPRPEILSAVRDTLRRMVDACIPVFMVPGNHDAITLRLNPYRELARAARVVVQSNGETSERRWPVLDEQGRRLAEKHSVYILGRPTFAEPITVETEAGALHVYGIAYDAAESRDPLGTFRRGPDPGVHAALLHASVHDASHWRASGNSLAVTTDALSRLDVDYIALGDHHAHHPPDDMAGPPACYPGSFAATDVTEAGPHGYVIVEVEPGGSARIEHRDAGVRQTASIELDVSTCRDEIHVAEAATRLVPPRAIPLIRLVGEPSFPLDADAIATELRERFGHAEIRDETRYYASDRLDELAGSDTVLGHLVRIGRDRIGESEEPLDREVAQRALRVALRALGAD